MKIADNMSNFRSKGGLPKQDYECDTDKNERGEFEDELDSKKVYLYI